MYISVGLGDIPGFAKRYCERFQSTTSKPQGTVVFIGTGVTIWRATGWSVLKETYKIPYSRTPLVIDMSFPISFALDKAETKITSHFLSFLQKGFVSFYCDNLDSLYFGQIHAFLTLET